MKSDYNITTYTVSEINEEIRNFKQCCINVGGYFISFETRDLPGSIPEFVDTEVNFAWHVWLNRNKKFTFTCK